MKTESIKQDLDQLKAQFQQKAIFNQSDLEQRQSKARSRHDPYQIVFANGLRLLMAEVVDKFSKGFTYNDGPYSANLIQPYSCQVILRKPESVIESELAEIDAVTEASYRAEVESAKEPLLLEIAQTQLLLKEAETAERDKVKRDVALAKLLELVTRELVPDAEEEPAPEAQKE